MLFYVSHVFFSLIFEDLVLGLPNLDFAQTNGHWKACNAIFLKVPALKLLDLANYEHGNVVPNSILGVKFHFRIFVSYLCLCRIF